MSVRAAAVRAVVRVVLMGLGFAVTFAILTALDLAPDVIVEEWSDPPPSETSRMVERHGCWTGEAPEGAGIPGHAVVRLPGHDRPSLVDSRIGFDMWLGVDGSPGTGDERRGTLHAFCP